MTEMIATIVAANGCIGDRTVYTPLKGRRDCH